METEEHVKIIQRTIDRRFRGAREEAFESLAALHQRCNMFEGALKEAQALLALVYDDRTEWRTNQWFKRVENVGGWPRP